MGSRTAKSCTGYGKDIFDKERYERIRDIASEMVAFKTDIPSDKVKDLFCCETGYQTPKLDSRAAIFKGDKILLVQEKNGRWSLPGGWVDVNISVKENVIKEVKEEAGLDVTADMVIAVQDREKHNLPVYAYKVCKFLCCARLSAVNLKKTRKLFRVIISVLMNFRNCHWKRIMRSR